MFRRTIAAVLISLAMLAPAQVARASQGNQVLPTTGLITAIENNNLISAAIAALNTCNSGTSAPANATGAAPAAGQCWDDTSVTPSVRKIYDGASWVVVGSLDATNHIWIPQLGGGTATLASASTVDLCSVPQSYISVTGTTTITSFGASSCANGSVKILRFSGALTINHNASTLTIPGSANWSIAAGDTVTAVRATSGRWDIVVPNAALVVPGGGGGGDSLPVATMLTYGGFALPANYDWCAGQVINRNSFPDYLAAVTNTQSVTRTNGSAVLTGFSSTEQFRAGMDVEGTGIPASTTIASKTSTTVTLSANASSSGTGDVTVFAHGNGNGSSTVNLPDLRGRVAAGRDDLNDSAASRLTAAAPNSCTGNGLGASCGSQQGTLTEAQLPSVSKTVNITVSGTTGSNGAHDHFTVASQSAFTSTPISTNNSLSESGNIGGFTYVTAGSSNADLGLTSSDGAHTHSFSDSASDNVSFGSGTAHTRLQPTLITNCIIKVSN